MNDIAVHAGSPLLIAAIWLMGCETGDYVPANCGETDPTAPAAFPNYALQSLNIRHLGVPIELKVNVDTESFASRPENKITDIGGISERAALYWKTARTTVEIATGPTTCSESGGTGTTPCDGNSQFDVYEITSYDGVVFDPEDTSKKVETSSGTENVDCRTAVDAIFSNGTGAGGGAPELIAWYDDRDAVAAAGDASGRPFYEVMVTQIGFMLGLANQDSAGPYEESVMFPNCTKCSFATIGAADQAVLEWIYR